ncbi:MAG: transposase [Armatimonadota bacterium]
MTDRQWQLVEALIPRQNRRGRRRQDDRQVLNGILWVLRTGEPWKNLPSEYPSYQTCHRRFLEWKQQGVLNRILETLARNP